MRGTIHDPKVENDQVDCPKDGCGGIIRLDKNVCGRCGTSITRIYRHRGKPVRMTFRTNGNKNL